jgi:hypothetical protein
VRLARALAVPALGLRGNKINHEEFHLYKLHSVVKVKKETKNISEIKKETKTEEEVFCN